MGGSFIASWSWGAAAPPTRLVVWSWPSEKVICSYRKNAQLKACRTNIEGYYLASFIDNLPAATPLTLGGYSYGARVVTGGLHLLGGGTLEGRELTERQISLTRRSTHALLIGAAMANNWLLPGMRHEHAISQVEPLVIMYNPKDFVLHFYPRLWGGQQARRSGGNRSGGTGAIGSGSSQGIEVNVQPQMQRRHGWDYVAGSPAIMSRTA